MPRASGLRSYRLPRQLIGQRPAKQAKAANQTIELGALRRSRQIDQQNQISVKARFGSEAALPLGFDVSTQDDAAWRPGVNKSLVLTRGRVVSFQRCGLAKPLSEEVRHLNEESSPVPAKARLELIRKRTEAVATEIVVVSDIKSRSRIRRPAKQKLPFNV